jgi:uncharacterized RDD family membrane protein YckC
MIIVMIVTIVVIMSAVVIIATVAVVVTMIILIGMIVLRAAVSPIISFTSDYRYYQIGTYNQSGH